MGEHKRKILVHCYDDTVYIYSKKQLSGILENNHQQVNKMLTTDNYLLLANQNGELGIFNT
jgi:hypothetical protein